MAGAGLALLGSPPAAAAPFCVAQVSGNNLCIYHDAVECRKIAEKNRERCIVNSREIPIPANATPYCVVTTYRTVQCWYHDQASCRRDALQNGGICIDTKR